MGSTLSGRNERALFTEAMLKVLVSISLLIFRERRPALLFGLPSAPSIDQGLDRVLNSPILENTPSHVMNHRHSQVCYLASLL